MIATAVIATFLLAGEPVAFDGAQQPRFTPRQIASSAEATRAGLAKWAATAVGKRLIARFRQPEYEIAVVEDRYEPSPGRAPQPGIATLMARPGTLKRYELILNPFLANQYGAANAIDLGRPVTPADVMAGAWAGEMLHIEFYASAIPLPHHERPDFQQRWQQVAIELGFPLMKHHTDQMHE